MLIMFIWAKHDLVSQSFNTFEDLGGQNQMQAFFPPSLWRLQDEGCRRGYVGLQSMESWWVCVCFFFFNSTHPLSFGCPGTNERSPWLACCPPLHKPHISGIPPSEDNVQSCLKSQYFHSIWLAEFIRKMKRGGTNEPLQMRNIKLPQWSRC